MTVVEHELKRHRALLDGVTKKKRDGIHREESSVLCFVHLLSVVKGTNATAKKEYEKAKKNYQLLLKKQDTLLRGMLVGNFWLLQE